jgi:hypothetical protein
LKECGRKALERVLVSWVAHNPRVGYCQSMNFLAAMVLAVCKGNEDDALTIFTCLIEDTSFGEYYCRETDFETLLEDTKKLETRILTEEVALAKHLQDMDFQFSSITPTWFLTCFFLQIGPQKAILVLDKVLQSGKLARDFLVDYAAKLIINTKEELLNCHDMEGIYLLLKQQRSATM